MRLCPGRLDQQRASDYRANTGPGDTTYLCTVGAGADARPMAVSLIHQYLASA